MSDSAVLESKASDPKVKSSQADTDAVLPPQRTESRQSIQNAPATGAVNNEPKVEEVAALAYQLWIERGSPHGSHEEDWYRAEEQLRAQPPTSSASA